MLLLASGLGCQRPPSPRVLAAEWVEENLLTVPSAREAAEFFEQQRAAR